MDHHLPHLAHKDLTPTRDYVQEVSLVLGSLQRAFVPKNPHDWHYGLEVGLRGLLTQPMTIAGEELRASLDLVRHKVRIGGNAWSLEKYAAPEIINNIERWLESRKVSAAIEWPKRTADARHFDSNQSTQYAAALWWMNKQFRELKASLKDGLTSPILLYPHHFDLSLVWFPHADERQLAIGFSTGDETITEPYLYLTAYPEPAGFTSIDLPAGAHWQTTGFSGAILPYNALSESPDPVKVFQNYANIFTVARPLLG